MKIFQYDKTVWDDCETSHTWQFGIVKNTSLLWVRYENPTHQFFASGGFHVSLSFLASSLMSVDFQQGFEAAQK